jgi:excinuclease UvrABC ATPase subunit
MKSSVGPAQRVKLAAEPGKLKRGKHNLYILDEPTTGLHFADIQRLLDSLNRLPRGRSQGGTAKKPAVNARKKRSSASR